MNVGCVAKSRRSGAGSPVYGIPWSSYLGYRFWEPSWTGPDANMLLLLLEPVTGYSTVYGEPQLAKAATAWSMETADMMSGWLGLTDGPLTLLLRCSICKPAVPQQC